MRILLFIISLVVFLNTSMADSFDNQEIYDINLVHIPSGSFEMGSLKGYGDEKPVHNVTLDEFWMSATEITQAQYEAVVGTNSSEFKGDDNLPVERVSWFDAVIFCNRLSETKGFEQCYDPNNWECDYSRNGFRLPTEAEWEYAARGNMQLEYGTENGGLSTFSANYNVFVGSTTYAGSYPANYFGLYDMAGNLWEWCNDWYDYIYYKNSPENNPTGPQSGSFRIIRGGSWGSKWHRCRAAFRNKQQPDFRHGNIGFRVVHRP